MRMKLNQKFIDRDLRCPEGRKQIEYTDSEGVRGVYVLVTAKSPGVGTYYLRYKNESGKTCHKKIGRTTDINLKDARDKAKVLKLEVSQGKDPQADVKQKRNEMTYAEFMLEHYFPYAESRFRNASRYRSLWDAHLHRLGDVKVNSITKRMVQEFHSDLHARGYSNAYCNRFVQLLKSSINVGIEMEIFDIRNPAKIRLYEEHGRDRYLSDQELSRLMPVLLDDDSMTAKIIRFLLATGLRLGECLNAKWSDIDLDNLVMVIPAVRAKSKRVDSIPLNSSAAMVLSECSHDTDYPFANPATCNPYVDIKRSFQSLMKKAGLEGVTAHTLRHTAASLIINSGGTLYEAQRLLRHSNSDVTARYYAHLSPKSARAASDTISNSLMKAASGDS